MPTIKRQEVPRGWSRARSAGLRPGDPYLLAFLGTIGMVLGVGCLWSALVRGSSGRPSDAAFAGWALFGILLLVSGFASWIPLRNRWARRREAPLPPATALPRWRFDHDWDLTWVRSDASRLRGDSASFLLVGIGFTLAFLVVPERKMGFLACWFGVMVLVGWGRALYYLARATKFAGGRLRLPYCPLPLGGEVTVYLCDLDRIKGARSVTAILRFVAEEQEWRQSARGSALTWVRYARFEEVRTFGPKDLPFGAGAPARLFRLSRPAGPGTELPLRFQLPQDERFDTHLAANPPCYWELEVRADLPGIDYLGVFLLPVYAKGK